jgi:hypothetical protein
MKLHRSFLALSCATALGLMISPAVGQVLYQQNFDADDSTDWTVNNGPSDEAHDFFFDYSTMGIPSAPHSSGGSTRGMKLQANLFNGVFSGMSVSPNGQSFSGDYSVTFDWWANAIGPLDVGAAGSTMLSTFGVETSGTFANWPGTADGTFFAVTGDGGSSVDLRVYSPERAISYQLPVDTAVLDGMGQPIDAHANYLGGSRNSNVAPYTTAFPGGNMAPALQQTNYAASQTGTTAPGAADFQWNQMEMRKVGNIIRLFANGVELMNVDKTNYVTPNAGTNIMFGMADINAGTSIDPTFPDLEFTLIDNVKVATFVAPTGNSDFNNDNIVDGADFLIWQRGLGLTGQTGKTNGDANGDGNVDAADLVIWQSKYGGAPAAGAASAVPEPTGLVVVLAALVCLAAAAPRRRAALAPVATK